MLQPGKTVVAIEVKFPGWICGRMDGRDEAVGCNAPSRNYAAVVSRGAAESAEKGAGHEPCNLGNRSPKGDWPACLPKVHSPRLRVNLSPFSTAWLRPTCGAGGDLGRSARRAGCDAVVRGSGLTEDGPDITGMGNEESHCPESKPTTWNGPHWIPTRVSPRPVGSDRLTLVVTAPMLLTSVDDSVAGQYPALARPVVRATDAGGLAAHSPSSGPVHGLRG